MALNDKEKEGKRAPCFERATELIINAREMMMSIHSCATFDVFSFEENERTRDPKLYINVNPMKMSRSRGMAPIPLVGSKERTIKNEEITNPEREIIRRGEA